MPASRAEATRAHWLEVLAKYKQAGRAPDARGMWCPSLDGASRDEIRAIQNAKLAALTPFLYENSAFYRRRFEPVTKEAPEGAIAGVNSSSGETIPSFAIL